MMLEVPEELNGMVAALRDVMETVMTQFQRGQTGGSVNYAVFEEHIAEKVAEVERRGHEVALAGLAVNAPRVMINRVVHVRVLENVETDFQTLAGPARVARSLYRPVGQGGPRNPPVVDPVALRTGAVEGTWPPATARAMAFEVQQCTSREAEASGANVGRLRYSHASFEHIAHAVGEAYIAQHQGIEQALIEAFEVPVEARSVSVSLDRVTVPIEEPRERPADLPREKAPKRTIQRVFRMAYCGTVTLHDGNGEAIHTIRYGTMPGGDPEALCEGMAGDVVELLAQCPALEVVLLCDGAAEMWNLLDAEFTAAPFDTFKSFVVTRLIDFWHTIEKLAAAARVIVGETEAKPLVARWKLLLRNTSSARQTILGELIASGDEQVSVGTDRPVHDAITYLTNNVARMDYASARRQGLPIGSGNVEATCKSLFGIKLKRAGSRWKNRTGEHIVHLRALALSDRWSAAMALAFKPPRVAIRAAA